MTSNVDSTGIDCVWIASDSVGQIAALVTAGVGPVPAGVLGGTVDLFDIEDRLLELPVVGDGSGVAGNGDISSFLDLARRGFFVFDWMDVHRIARDSVHAYGLIAAPTVPASITALPTDLRALARRQRLPATFGNRLTIDMLAN